MVLARCTLCISIRREARRVQETGRTGNVGVDDLSLLVDGGRRGNADAGMQSIQEEDEDGLEDGGVLGLLAQIYGTGANLKGRGRGPPRAI